MIILQNVLLHDLADLEEPKGHRTFFQLYIDTADQFALGGVITLFVMDRTYNKAFKIGKSCRVLDIASALIRLDKS